MTTGVMHVQATSFKKYIQVTDFHRFILYLLQRSPLSTTFKRNKILQHYIDIY